MHRLGQIAVVIGRAFRSVFVGLVGRLHWEAPPWLRVGGQAVARGGRALRARPGLAWALGLIVAAAIGAGIWYSMLPEPHYVTFEIAPPGITEYNDTGISSIKPLVVSFSESAAPLSDVQKPLTAGVTLSPQIAGTWVWTSDRELRFEPEGDWPVDGNFSVRFARRRFVAPEVTLDEYGFDFRSQPFAAEISDSQFYQDPVDPNLKKLVATVAFSHPVDLEALESHVSLLVARDAAYLGLAADSRHFTVAYDKFKLHAYVHSVPLAMPRDDTPMTLRVDAGVRAARGGNDTRDRLEAVVTIPGRSSLRFSGARMTVVDNARFEPEQILMLQSSSPVAERAFAGKVVVHLLPERHPRQPPEQQEPYNWTMDIGIGDDILSAAPAVPVTYVPSDEGGATTHGFRFQAPVGRYLHVVVEQDVAGIGGYVSGKPYVEAFRVEPYPQTLRFLGEGAILSPTGDRKVGYLSRDIEAVEVEIGRVLPNQLQHLSRQMWSFAKPSLYSDLEDRLVERFWAVRDYTGQAPGRPTYDNIDLAPYLRDQAGERRGLFLLHVRATTRKALEAAAAGDPGERYQDDGWGDGYYRRRPEDTRLVLITDLGFFVKRARDDSRDVFVQSIRTGEPLAGARVSLVGANGLTTLAATTDAAGRARLAATSPNLPREKRPQLIVVEREGDLAFMPFQTGDRSLSTSRFDVGGVQNAESATALSAYIFSDRGIYRPGETAHLGMVTRSADWQTPVTGVPLTVEVTDPRGTVVKSAQVAVSAGAFDELTYDAPVAAATGTYEAVAYIVKDERRRESIGSTTFRVQEFEPDRLKVQIDLSADPEAAWLRPSDVHARVTVAHLFGEAAGGRRVEGELTLSPALPRFTKYPDYRFQVGEALKDPVHETLAAVTTDGNGVAELALDLRRFVGRAYRLNVLSRAYEAAGGRNVAAQNSAIVSDATFLVGVKPDGDLTFVPRNAARAARWLAVDQKLNPVAARGLTLEWVQRKFASVLTQQDDRTFKYVSKLRETVLSSQAIDIPQGGTDVPLPTGQPGDFLLVLRDASGAKINSLGYSVAGDANVSRSLDRNAELQIQLDKASYRGGETIAASIRAPYAGSGLITIERDRVFAHRWFRTSTTSSVQRITLPDDFEGNGYVTVQFVRDPASTDLFISPLSYGVAAFGANLASRTEAVTLDVPRLVKPGESLTMKVAPGEASAVAVLAVDEGILQVARYRSPDPLGYFFQKRRLEVDTSQVLDLILPEFSQYLSLAAAGGDTDAGYSRHLNPFARKRKAAVAYWSGIVPVGREGRELTYDVPDYFNGRLRIVAIAVSPRRVGVAEVATEVRGDFILTPNVPATVTPGDEFTVSVGVFNNTTGGEGPIHLEVQPGSGLTLVGANGVDLTIADKREGVGEFRVRAGASLGSAPLVFAARRGDSEARMEEEVGIRPASAFRTQITLGRVAGGTASASLTRDLFGARRSVRAAVSVTPLAWAQGLIAYLDELEYSCTEQLVSRGVAALMVTARPEFGRVRSETGQTLESTLSVVRSRMNVDGGLGLWSSTPATAEFATVYAAHFLIEARDHNQRVPADVMARLNDWLARFAATPAGTFEAARARAYAVYLLARQGIRSNPALANVEQELTKRYPDTWASDLAAAYLASTYRIMQRRADADRMMRAVPWAADKRDFAREIYYGGAVHDAQLLYLRAMHFPALATAAPPAALDNIGASMSRGGGGSIVAAYGLLAFDALAKSASSTTTLGMAEIGKDGQRRSLTLPSGAIPTVAISEGAASVEFSRRGPNDAYFTLAESGFDRTPPAQDVRQGIEIVREFVDADGNVLTRVTVGQDFFVRLRVRALDRDVEAQIAVVDILPGGVEPVLELQPTADSSTPGRDPAMPGGIGWARALPVGVPGKSDWTPAHVDVREDRVVLYGDVGRNAGTFVYRVRANNAGTYQAPPAFAEGMYNRTIMALSRSAPLEVIKP